MRARSILMVVSVLLLLPAVQSFASDARLDALGVQHEYMEDYVNFRFFPTVAARYANLVTAGLGSRAGAGIDHNFQVGAIGSGENSGYGVFGLFLNNVQTAGVGQAQVDLTWAKQFEGVDVGASLLWQKSSETDNESRDKTSPIGRGPNDVNQFGLTGGVKINSTDKSFIEMAVEAAWLSWEETVGGVIQTKDDGKISYRLTGRMMSEVSSKTTLVPLLNYSHVNLTPDQTLTPTPDDLYVNALNLGLALHHKVNGDDLLVVGIAANYRKDQTLTAAGDIREQSVWDLPALFMALEFDLYHWLTARVGATKSMDNVNVTIADAAVPVDLDHLQSSFDFGLGFGAHFDHFDLDATVDPQAIFSGGYLLSGETSKPLTRVTGTYYW